MRVVQDERDARWQSCTGRGRDARVVQQYRMREMQDVRVVQDEGDVRVVQDEGDVRVVQDEGDVRVVQDEGDVRVVQDERDVRVVQDAYLVTSMAYV